MSGDLKDKETVVGIIPARFDSSRLQGKPLEEIRGKPMIHWVVERARQATLVNRVLVATDDERIYRTVNGFGGEVVMTPDGIMSGTDRVAFVAKNLDTEIIINIQGDEPLIEPDEIDLVVRILLEDDEAVMGTLVKKITEVEELKDPNTVKVVVDERGNALYFSRSPIPFYRNGREEKYWIQEHPYYKHVGIYSYRKEFLLRYIRWAPTPLEAIERLEQLRVLENGYPIKVAETIFDHICVDTVEDLERVRRLVGGKSG